MQNLFEFPKRLVFYLSFFLFLRGLFQPNQKLVAYVALRTYHVYLRVGLHVRVVINLVSPFVWVIRAKAQTRAHINQALE